MKKFLSFCFGMLVGISYGFASESSLTFANAGLSTGDVTSQSPIAIGEDLNLTFSKGGAMSAPSLSSAGRISLPMNSSLTVTGKSDDVLITRIDLISNKSSQTFSTGAASCVPEGTFTIDKSTYTSTWESAEGSNSVIITNTMGAPQFKEIRVTYSGGTGGDIGGGGGDKPEDPDPVIPGDNVFSTQFLTPQDFAKLSVINVEDGSYTWRYDSGKHVASIVNDMGNTVVKNDYLVTPALQLYAGHSYRISFSAYCENPSYPERIAAYVGNAATADALKIEVVAPVAIESKTPTEYSGVFTPEADGTYYAALHACSDAGMFYLYVDDFTVGRAVLPTCPADITDLTVTPAPNGDLKATVSCTAPAKCVDGSALAELSAVVIMRDGVEIASIPATPGQAITYTDNVAASGNYRYTAYAKSAVGKSADRRATAYIGVAAPLAPTFLTVSEPAPGELLFTWDAVSRNVYGHEIDPSIVTYTISANGTANIVAEGVTGTSTRLTLLKADDPQAISYFVIRGVTSAGSSASNATSPVIAYGTPYATPWKETFSDAMLDDGHVVEVIPDADNTSTFWTTFEAMVNDDIIPAGPDGGMLGLFSMDSGDSSTWRTAKIHIDENSSNPYLTFYYFVWPGAEDRIEIYANDDKIHTMTVGGETREWVRAAIPMASYKGKDIRLAFTGICADPKVRLAIDDIRIADEHATDIALTRARKPYEMIQGNTHKCNVRVKNLGIDDVEKYTVTLYAGGETIATAEGSLKADATASHDFDVRCTSSEPTDYKVEVSAAGDEVSENNVKEVTATVAGQHLSAPGNIRVSDAGIEWDKPVQLPREITEGFEAYDEFTTDKAGEWSFFDGDGCPVIGIRDGYHGYPSMFTPMAYMVFNNHDGFFPVIGTASYDPYEGGQCMMSAAVDVINSTDRDNDDWMISPLLSGEAQKISFFARSSGMVFPETFKLMASSTDPQASSFTEVMNVERVPNVWTKYEAELPQGCLYFAIRNVSHDQFMMFIDNVTFTAAPSTETPVGYDVYVSDAEDGKWSLLNDSKLTSTSVAADTPGKEAWIKVAATYASGYTAESEPYHYIKESVEGIGAENFGDPVYYNINGIRLDRYPETPGIYIERKGQTSRRVIIK